MKIPQLSLPTKIFVAIIVGVLVGSITTTDSLFYDLFSLMGTLFLQALKMVVIPVIAASMITAVIDVDDDSSIGRLGAKAITYMIFSTFFATIIGISVITIFSPGIGSQGLLDGLSDGTIASNSLLATTSTTSALDKVMASILSFVPSNIITAAATNQILGVIFFSILFGFAMRKSGNQVLTDFWQGTHKVIMSITTMILAVAPYGVFGLIATLIADTGFASFIPLLGFFACVVLALAIHVLITYSLFLKFLARTSFISHLRAMWPAMLTAFSTASSAATVPVTLNCLRTRVGASKRVSGFFVPMGATLNMDGTALYECAAVLFIAQLYGINLTFTEQLLVVVLAVVTSIGVAGIPAASLVAMGIIMQSVGLPLESIGVLLITDRVLDMLRTACNVYGDSVGTVVLATSEGETINHKP